MIQIGLRNCTEVNVPSGQNSFFSNIKDTQKEIENNINIINIINNNENKNGDVNNIQRNSIDSLKYSIKSESNININHNNNNNIKNEKKEDKEFTKSSTYNNQSQSINTFSYGNINDNINDNINNNNIQIQKSRTCQEYENFQRQSLTIRLNNIGRTHLETVLETLSEASNSKVDSSEISDDTENEEIKENDDNKENKENYETNENTGKYETKESGKNKDSENNNTEQKIQGSDIRINDNDFNVVTKKSLFLASEKTH